MTLKRIELGGGYALVEGLTGIWYPVFGQGATIQDEANARAFALRFNYVGDPPSRIRHRASGGTYAECGRAELQISGEWELEEGDIIVVYQSEADGKLWAREKSEFEDGRFERLT